MNKYFILLRPQQWVKNILCFAGIIFSGKFINLFDWIAAFNIFIAFSFAASTVYIFNDIMDAPKDRLHPIKKNRPIANNSIPLINAWLLLFIILCITFYLAWRYSNIVVLIITFYFICNFIYSFKLKQLPILDVFIISIGFILRLLSGTIGLGIPPSEWIIICTFMLALFFGFVKRNCEMQLSSHQSRSVTNQYSIKTLDKLIAITASSAIMSYTLFIINKAQFMLIITVIPVCYAIFHIILDLDIKKKGEDFSRDLFVNYHIIGALIVWLSSYCLFVFY